MEHHLDTGCEPIRMGPDRAGAGNIEVVFVMFAMIPDGRHDPDPEPETLRTMGRSGGDRGRTLTDAGGTRSAGGR